MSDPALIHEPATAASAAGAVGPRTHVLLVGIGVYKHLGGGGGPPATDHFGLGQLTSPPASARALADWFITAFDCPDRPLATVRLVLSEAAPAPYVNPTTSAVHQPPEADLAGLGAAVRAWAGTTPGLPGAAHPDDQLILYFCGHGLAGNVEQIYPLRDFGVDATDPFGKAVNLQKLATGLETVLASNQLLIMDACRDQEDLVAANAHDGSGLVVARPDRRFPIAQKMAQCIIHSTELDGKARGKPGEPSLCAEALMRALSGAAAKSNGGVWQIKSTLILDAISDLQARAFPGAAGAQRSDLGRFANIAVRRFPGPPKIPVFIRRSGGVSMAGAQVQYTPAGAPPVTVVSATPVWEGAVAIGPHVFTVSADGQALGAPISETAAPAFLDLEVP